MRVTVGALNLLLGSVYTSYGIMTAIEMKRGWRSYGFSHFGAAWIAMAFTCGPHHLAHGFHQAFEGRPAGVLDLVAILAGLPVGVTWFLLRVEAFAGGRGERFISGTPAWLASVPTASAVYATALVAASIQVGGEGIALERVAAPNVLLFGIYMTIAYFLLRTQLRNRGSLGGWSVSGTSLTAVFPTCAVMHAMYVLYAFTGLYGFDRHTYTIDWLGVPAGLYFLLVVRALYREALHDWNEASVEAVPVMAGR